MRGFNAWWAASISLSLWWVPEFDYWGHWYKNTMRSDVLPHIAGW